MVVAVAVAVAVAVRHSMGSATIETGRQLIVMMKKLMQILIVAIKKLMQIHLRQLLTSVD